jgi:uncharacterized membrane protein YfcA
MELYQALILIIAGMFAGFINTVAGGGSLITLPVMIFMGLPPAVANGSNRIALVVQNIFATAGFRSKGISAWPYSLYLSISALAGAIIGAQISVEISGVVFNRILSVVMLLVIVFTVFNPMKKNTFQMERLDPKHQKIGIITFFFIGIYGGFIQAGVGFIVIAALSVINHMNLVKINSAKVFIILIYTISAIVIFAINGKINWLWGLVLAIGNSTGGWIGSRWQVDKGEKWIKRVLLVMVIAMSVKLWFF